MSEGVTDLELGILWLQPPIFFIKNVMNSLCSVRKTNHSEKVLETESEKNGERNGTETMIMHPRTGKKIM